MTADSAHKAVTKYRKPSEFRTTGGVRVRAYRGRKVLLDRYGMGATDKSLTYLNIKLQSASSSGSGKICPDCP